MIFLPETPPWLVLHGREEEAEKVLKWLRGQNFDISRELEALSAAQGGAGAQAVSFTQTLAAFKYPGAYKPFSILLLVFIFQQLSGSYAIIFYAVTLFKVTYSVLHETYNKLQGHRSVNEPIRSCDRHRGHQADRDPAR